MTTDDIHLGPTSYGKSAVRLVKVVRDGERHHIRDLTVDIALTGAFDRCFVDGDNSDMPATDTLRNVVYALAKEHPLDSVEAFGLHLARHYLAIAPSVSGVRVRLVEHPWQRLPGGEAGHDHAFTREAGERIAVVQGDGAGLSVEAGLDKLLVLKTTNSGWEHFHRDAYTTLPDARDRILATNIAASWSYGAHEGLEFEQLWYGVRACILESFGDHYSPSVQHTIYRIGRAVLERFPPVERISLTLPNKHHLLFNLAPFGLDNPGEIFHVTDEPYGLIDGTIERGG